MTTTGLDIVRIDESIGTEEPLELDPTRLAAGSPVPVQHVRNLFTDATGHFFSGIWHSTPGAWRVTYSENELCVLTEGRVRVTDDRGQATSFGPGDCWVMPAGFRGLWEVLEPARKFYAIYEPPT
jgi:uncharacterized protein